MSHFYAEIQGTKGVASRCGDKSNGIWGIYEGGTMEYILPPDIIKIKK